MLAFAGVDSLGEWEVRASRWEMWNCRDGECGRNSSLPCAASRMRASLSRMRNNNQPPLYLDHYNPCISISISVVEPLRGEL